MSKGKNTEKLECPQCGNDLGKLPENIVQDIYKHHCSDCEEFVQISMIRQKQKKRGD